MKFYPDLSTANTDTINGSLLDGIGAITQVILSSGTQDFFFRDVTKSSPNHTVTASLIQADVVQTSDNGTGDSPNAAGFNAGTLTNTAVEGTGTAASVELEKQITFTDWDSRSVISGSGGYSVCNGGDVTGNVLVGACTNVWISDISDISNPTLSAIYVTPDTARDVDVAGNYAYVADSFSGGLQIIDISTPNAPSFAASIVGIGTARAVKVQGNYAYVGATDLNIINISDPLNPTLSNTFITGASTILGIDVQGNYVYTGHPTNDKFNIIDVTDELNPTLVSTFVHE